MLHTKINTALSSQFLYVLFLGVTLINVACGDESLSISKEIVFDEEVLSIPVSSEVRLDRIKFQVMGDELVYNHVLDLHFYNIHTGEERLDTTLRNFDYTLLGNPYLYGVMDSLLIFKDGRYVWSYDTRGHHLHNISKQIDETLTSGDDKTKWRLAVGGIGFAPRYLSNFLPFSDMRSFSPDNPETSLCFYEPGRIEKIKNNMSVELPQLLYDLQTNHLFPMLESTLDQECVNLSFKLSCKVYRIDKNGNSVEYNIRDPECICGLNQDNITVAKTELRILPASIPKYGNLYPDFHRNHYYQFYFSATDRGRDEMTFYLRVIDKDYNVIARRVLDLGEIRGQLLFLKGGVYIQSNSNPLETHATFQKIILKDKR